MKAELVLSRSCYRAGTPVVGTVRIHCPPSTDATQNDNNNSDSHSIRDDVVSARLYLAGRSYLGNKQKVSRWRSSQEIFNLQKLYGEDGGHACLRMAKLEESAHWQREQNDNFEENEGWDDRRNAAIIKQPPEVTHIEQAERLAIHSHLYPKYNQSNERGEKNDYSHLPSFTENNTICFFMTNVLELLDVPERPGNFHEDMNPFRPLQLPDLNAFRDAMEQNNDLDNNHVDEEYSDNGEEGSHGSSSYSSSGEYSDEEYTEQHQYKESSGDATTTTSSVPTWQQIMNSAKTSSNSPASPQLDHTQIVLSFRTGLPTDLPPTLSAECVKYFYSAVLVVTTTTGEILAATCPFAVLTANSPYLLKSDRDATSTRVHIGELHAIAHSNSLPILISSTDVSTKISQLNVIANPPARSILSRRTAEHRTSTHKIQDSNGGLCGWMTLVGFGGPLSPSTRLAVCVEFPNFYSDESVSTRIIGCYRVCCGLVGEEYAICETNVAATSNSIGRTTDNPPSSTTVKRKTRSYVFDSAYEMVEFGHTDRISMDLLLPSHCPVTVKTDLVEVTVTLKVEFTVDRTSVTPDDIGENSSNEKDSSELGVIRLDLPCEVVHSGIGLNEDPEDNEEEEERNMSSTAFSRGGNNNKEDIFEESDLSDLNVLSLEMFNSFG